MTANPVMTDAAFQRAERLIDQPACMTVQGSVLKSAILVSIVILTGGFAWAQLASGANGSNQSAAAGFMIGGLIGGLITSLIIFFSPKTSPFVAPVYAAFEGVFMGTLSALFEAKFPGIVLQAVGLSVGVLVMMLFLYGTGIIRVTEKFRLGVVAATGAVCLVYLVSMIGSLVGYPVPYIHSSGPIGIGFSVVVVIIAAINLLLDFDFIERGSKYQAPKYMEWYAGYGLLVTLVWMYLEILRLLAKLRSND